MRRNVSIQKRILSEILSNSNELWNLCHVRVLFFSSSPSFAECFFANARACSHNNIYISIRRRTSGYIFSPCPPFASSRTIHLLYASVSIFFFFSLLLSVSLSWLERFFPPIWPYEANMLSFPSFVLSFFFRTLLL